MTEVSTTTSHQSTSDVGEKMRLTLPSIDDMNRKPHPRPRLRTRSLFHVPPYTLPESEKGRKGSEDGGRPGTVGRTDFLYVGTPVVRVGAVEEAKVVERVVEGVTAGRTVSEGGRRGRGGRTVRRR
jgi:hypothetical protein